MFTHCLFDAVKKVRDHCHYTGKYKGAAHSICNLQYKTPKKIPEMFHKGSTYDYHFIIKKLAKEFEGQFECLGENTEKHITFPVPIQKDLDNCKTITYKIKFIDSFGSTSSSLSSIKYQVDNLLDGFYYDKCIYCRSYIDYIITKNDQLIFRCFESVKKKKKNQKDCHKHI